MASLVRGLLFWAACFASWSTVQTVQRCTGHCWPRPAVGKALGTGVPAEGLALAGTDALQCRPAAGTGWEWALQCR